MNVLLYLSAPILAIALLGCNAPTATSTEQAPKAVAQADIQLDFSTPDKSLKTFWQIRDRIREQERVLYSEDQPKRKEFQDGLRRATTVDVFQTLSAGLSPVDKFERDILEVKVESESRAVVTVRIRNTTPIPAGAEVSKYEEASRRDGNRLRYIMEKSGTDWRVSELWEVAIYPAGEWRKTWPLDGKPRVGSLTFDGH